MNRCLLPIRYGFVGRAGHNLAKDPVVETTILDPIDRAIVMEDNSTLLALIAPCAEYPRRLF